MVVTKVGIIKGLWFVKTEYKADRSINKKVGATALGVAWQGVRA